MSAFIAALPMYDWPEARAEIDAQWAALRDALRARDVEAPDNLVRSNADMPPVPGGILDASGAVIAPDPATLPPEGLDLNALWLHPRLLLAQTCWGPMELGLARHVQVVGQPDYSAFEGGADELYSSVIVMARKAVVDAVGCRAEPVAPRDGAARLPLALLRGRRLVYNGDDSMSGILALGRDLQAQGESLDIFAERGVSGGHRASIVAIAEGRADVAALDCRSWHLAQRFEPAAREVAIVGWTARREGLPYIAPRALPAPVTSVLRSLL